MCDDVAIVIVELGMLREVEGTVARGGGIESKLEFPLLEIEKSSVEFLCWLFSDIVSGYVEGNETLFVRNNLLANVL